MNLQVQAVKEYIELLKEVEARAKVLTRQAFADMDKFIKEGDAVKAVKANSYIFHIGNHGMKTTETIKDLKGCIK